MKRLVVLIGLAVLIAGCTSARISRDLSSGVVGCPAEEITIVNEEATMSGTHTWVAVCNGKKFACGYQETTGVNCKEIADTTQQNDE